MNRFFTGAVVLGMLAALAGCGLADTEAAHGPPTPVPTSGETPKVIRILRPSSPAPTAGMERVALVDYVQAAEQPDGALVRTPTDVDALPGAPEDLRRHLAALVSRSDMTDCPLVIHVERVRTDGWAIGTLRSCEEERRVLWIREGGSWSEAASADDVLDCSALAAVDAPVAVAGEQCREDGTLVAYGQGRQSTVTPTTATVVDGRYENARFGYSCEVPEGWTGRESDDGADLDAHDPSEEAEYSCLGGNTSFLAQAATTESVRESARVGLEEQGVRISYDELDGAGFALSGTREGAVVYLWMIVGEGSVNGVWWSCPEDRTDALDDAVARSVRTFVPGDLDTAH